MRFVSLLLTGRSGEQGPPGEGAAITGGRVEIRVLREAWGRAVRETGDELLGLHLAEKLPFGSLDLIDYLTRSCATLGAAFQQFIRYSPLLANAGQMGFALEDGMARFHHHAVGAVPGISQLLLALVLVRAREFTGAPIRPKRVEFMHSPRGGRAEYQRLFQAPVTFGCPIDALYFEPGVMELPLRNAEPRLAVLLGETADRLLAAVPPPDSFASSVRLAVGEAIAVGDVRVERVAERLGMTPRTLQRRIAELGTSMREIIADERRRVAIGQLENGAAKQQVVAQTVGYANASSLHRAMRRWKDTR